MSYLREAAYSDKRSIVYAGLLAFAFAGCSHAAGDLPQSALGVQASAGTTGPLSTAAAGASAGAVASSMPGAAAGDTSAPPVAGTAAVTTGASGTSAGMTAAAGSTAGASAAAAGVGGAAGSLAAGSGGGAGGAGGADAAAGSGGSADAPHEDLGKGDGSDVVELGDSYMSNSLQIEGTGGGIVPSLQKASGQRYRNYAVQGTMLLMADSFGPAIPTQWDDAKRANAKIKTVIMTGGGNDIIQSDALKASCMMGGDDCKQLLIKEAQAFDQLWSKMADSGVLDIIHVGYAQDTGTVDPSLIKDAMTPPICTSGRVRCHELDTTALIMKQLAGDGIHPLQAANDRVAKAIADLMVKEGIRR